MLRGYEWRGHSDCYMCVLDEVVQLMKGYVIQFYKIEMQNKNSLENSILLMVFRDNIFDDAWEMIRNQGCIEGKLFSSYFEKIPIFTSKDCSFSKVNTRVYSNWINSHSEILLFLSPKIHRFYLGIKKKKLIATLNILRRCHFLGLFS